jgi:hypothetical protein
VDKIIRFHSHHLPSFSHYIKEGRSHILQEALIG